MREVDPWRFTGGFLSKILSSRIPDEPNHAEIPWAEVRKPLAESKLALLSTAGLSMRGDAPFDMEMERQKPTQGDPSWRRLRSDATSALFGFPNESAWNMEPQPSEPRKPFDLNTRSQNS